MTAGTRAPYVVLSAVLLVVGVAASSTGDGRRPAGRDLDLLSSAQPSVVRPVVTDTAFDEVLTRDRTVRADVGATASADCDGCAGDSTSLQVVYGTGAGDARLDNAAVAWTQGCQGCTAAALSVQVVVLSGTRRVVPSNRALSVTAACTDCRTAAVAFQVVVLTEHPGHFPRAWLAGLRDWVDTQAAAVRATVATPLPPPPPDPEPTATPTPTGTPTETPTEVPTATTTGPTAGARRPYAGRLAEQVSTDALADLEALVTTGVDAQVVDADVDLGR